MIAISAQLDDVPAAVAPITLAINHLAGDLQLAAELHIGQGQTLAVCLAADEGGVDVIGGGLGIGGVLQQIFAGQQGPLCAVLGDLLRLRKGLQRLLAGPYPGRLFCLLCGQHLL